MEQSGEGRIAEFVGWSEQSGCVELSEVAELVDELELEEEQVAVLLEQLDSRGVEVADDCARDVPERVNYANDALALTTTDTCSCFSTS